MSTDTDKIQAVRRHWPNLDKDLLDEMNEGVGQNGGTVRAVIEWNKGRFKWLDWVIRRFSRK